MYRSEAGPSSAWVFDTLSTPHGATSLPGEERAEALYVALSRVVASVESGDLDARADALAMSLPTPQPTSARLRTATRALETCWEEAQQGRLDDGWVQRARSAMRGVVRISLEMRLVAWFTPD